MAKAAVTRSIRDDYQKNFLKIFEGLTGKHSRWEIWRDFIHLTAIEISNSTDKLNAPERTKDYQTIISKYSAAERNGMAEMLAFLNICKNRNICYHNKVLVVAQDIDFIVGLMCYIQCSFMGCAGYVVIGDTITDPATAYDDRGLLPAGPQNRIWYMPFFSTDMWYMRRQIAKMNLLIKPKEQLPKIEKPETKPENLQKSIKNEPKAPEKAALNETRTGQLTFF